MPTSTRDERLAPRVEVLYADDAQFAAAKHIRAISQAIEQPELRLQQLIQIVMEGYADRPALGQRAVEFRTDPDTGRTSSALLPRLETISYRELWDRIGAVIGAWKAEQSIHAGDRVCLLGFTSVDYTTLDIAVTQAGAVGVPLQTGTALNQLQAIVAETEPTLVAASVDHLSDAVELVSAGPAAARLLVFDYHPEIDDHREALDAARDRLAGEPVAVETLADVIDRGTAATSGIGYPPEPETENPLTLLMYTSGSTGAPKGAMYSEQRVMNLWHKPRFWFEAGALPVITLNFMPMSHIMGRQALYGTLCSGGTAYFVADSDLSTLFDDLALVRPTELSLVPRVWDMLFDRFQSEVDRRTSFGADTETAAAQARVDMRADVLGGRYVSAMTGSAPMSDEMKAWVESLLEIHLRKGYGSTEAGSVLMDGRIRHPDVTDHKLVDVPELGYYLTDRPHPRGELLIKTRSMFSGYYKRPETTAGVFDADGFYRTGDVMAEVGPAQFVYVDRRNNVLKLSQGELIAVSKLEPLFGDSPLVAQAFIYGNSARPYLLAVIVPT